jgi:hypothetical protein
MQQIAAYSGNMNELAAAYPSAAMMVLARDERERPGAAERAECAG